MRRYILVIAQIFLFLSFIVNFALAAPVVVVRGAHEVHVNVVDVEEDATATSRKRWDDWLTNAADQTSALTAGPLPDLYHSRLHGPRSSTRSNNAPSSSESVVLSTGPHPRGEDDTPRPSSWSPEYSPIPWVPDRSSTSSPDYSQPNQLSTDNSNSSPNYSPPPSSTADSHPSDSGYVPSSSEPPRLSQPQTKDFINQLGATGPPSPAETKDLISLLGTTQDPGPPSPSEPETKDFISQLEPERSDFEPEAKDFLSYLLEDKIKRRISGSSAEDSVQES